MFWEGGDNNKRETTSQKKMTVTLQGSVNHLFQGGLDICIASIIQYQPVIQIVENTIPQVKRNSAI